MPVLQPFVAFRVGGVFIINLWSNERFLKINCIDIPSVGICPVRRDVENLQELTDL